MKYIEAAGEVWHERALAHRIASLDEQAQLQVLKIAEEAGARVVLRVIDAVQGFETPTPPIEFIAGYSTYLYFSDITR
ncbi:hypothetical protein KC957_03615 [Candidatus Saccharibacteria bacterium]|nr:hypothetical protein [Candidatus Saccharibacteria bacterium]